MKRNLFVLPVIMLYFGFILITLSTAAENTDTNKHSAIVEADGYVYLADDKTIRQLREEALAQAKREALEKGQTFIKSVSTVENFQLTYDLIQSAAEGYVKILESKDIGITQDNRYHYWVKAEIEYRLQSPESSVQKALDADPGAPLTVTVLTNKENYRKGENIKIFLKGNKDFYARVLYIDAQGSKLQLVPNQQRAENFFKGGVTHVIPDPADKFVLEVNPPFGSEKIIVYASTSQQGQVQTTAAGESLYRIESDINTVNAQTRGVVLKDSSGQMPAGAEFFETSCEVKTNSK